MNETSAYFAYGSNLSQSQMSARCPGSSVEGVAVLREHRLAFSRYSKGWDGGVADVVADANNSVWGLLYSVTPKDLEQLDRYEGYPTMYSRFQTRLDGPQGPVDDVWVYYVVDKVDFILPDPGYLSIIKLAAEDLGFPEEYRRMLDKIPSE